MSAAQARRPGAGRAPSVVLALGLGLGAVAGATEIDPDSPAVHAAAKEALTRAQRFEIKSESRELTSERRDIVMTRLDVQGQAEKLDGLLRDLDAQVRGREVRIVLSADVLFDFDKAELKPEATPSLQKVAEILKSYPKATAAIEGHTDARGNDAYNQKLSERRAESVRKWLEAHGASLKLTTRGFGKHKPVAPNVTPQGKDDPEGRRKNRRVDVIVQGAIPAQP